MQHSSRKSSVLFGLALSLLIPTTFWGADQVAKPKGKHTAVRKENPIANHLQQLEQQITKQQSLINQQQDRIDKLEQLLQQNNTQQQEHEANIRKDLQQTADQTAGVEKTTNLLNSTVTALKSSISTAQVESQKTQTILKSLEEPQTLRYKGLNITPGGFLEADFLVRSRNENADVTSNFGSVPFDGVANSKLSEFRASSRASRLFLLTETMFNKTKLSGYYEIDFLGQAPTSNQVQTNSFVPRQRQLWVQAAFPNNVTLTAGQFWSLITTDRKGLATRAEFIPTTVEGSYVTGYNYVRQTAFRVTKNYNNKVWTAFEVSNAETNQPNASYVPSNLFGFNNSSNASSPNGSTLNYLSGSTNGFSTNLAPDLHAKIVWEPRWGHYEFKVLDRFFRDRINGSNNYSYGGGIGAAAILPVVAKKVDVIAEGFGGNGIGRYGAANGSDVTLRPDGKIIPLRAYHALVGMEVHPTARLDIYTYGGNEYYGRAAYVSPTSSTSPAGYGSRLVNNTYCGVEVVPTGGAACGAQNKDVAQATGGFWYRAYRGNGGTLQYGVQYEFVRRVSWSGIGGAPSGQDNIVITSVRYILP